MLLPMLLQLQEGDAMTQCQKEAREHKIVANWSTKSARGRVDFLAGEEVRDWFVGASPQERGSVDNTVV